MGQLCQPLVIGLVSDEERDCDPWSNFIWSLERSLIVERPARRRDIVSENRSHGVTCSSLTMCVLAVLKQEIVPTREHLLHHLRCLVCLFLGYTIDVIGVNKVEVSTHKLGSHTTNI